MIKDLLIYGDIVPFRVYENEISMQCLHDKINALNLTPDDELRVNLNTYGGCTVTAFAMYNLLRRLVNEKQVKRIITRIDGYCASSGVILLLAGDERVGNAFAEPFVHNAWTYVGAGNAKDMIKQGEDLSRVDKQIATLYAQVTTITVDVALEYMNSETWVSVEDCKKFGFYTTIENVVGDTTAREVFNSLRQQRFNNVNTNTKMSTRTKNKNNKGLLGAIVNYLSAQNKLILTASDTEIDFYELEDGDTPKVGDKATIDGKPAGEFEDGKILMKSGETYVFTGEELTSIEPVADEGDDEGDDEALTQAQAENATLNKKLNSLQKKYNKIKSEKAASDALLLRINSIKDKQIRNILAGEDDEEDEDEEESEDDEEDEDEEDDNGFPKKTSQRTQTTNSAKKKVVTNKKDDTGSVLAEIKLNMFKRDRA